MASSGMPFPVVRIGALLAALALSACAGGDTKGASLAPSGVASVTRIQSQVFAKSCTFSSCHVTGGSGAIATGMVLTNDSAVMSLVNRLPSNGNAVAAGMKIIAPGKPDSSFLWVKLTLDTVHHGGTLGGKMPLGGFGIPLGQIEYIKRWIAAGAPAAGDVIDTTLLLDRVPSSTGPAYTALTPPTQGVQLVINTFSVNPAFERELFTYRTLTNTSNLFVNRIQTAMRFGSHHLVLYSFAPGTPGVMIPAPNTVRDLRRADGSLDPVTTAAMAFHVFLGGSQANTSDYQFPAGTALVLPAAAGLDLNSHYVNPTAGSITGEATVNLHTVDSTTVVHRAYTLNLNNTNILVPQGRDTTIIKTFPVVQTTRIFMLTSHMHARGTRFVIKIAGGARNGEVVYVNTDWAHPVSLTFATPIVLQPGEGLTSEVSYHGDPTRSVIFGLTSTDEMDIIFGYAY